MRLAAKPGDELSADAISALINDTRDSLITAFGYNAPYTKTQAYVGKQVCFVWRSNLFPAKTF